MQHSAASRALVPAFDQRASRPLEPAPDDPLAGAFHDAGPDRQAALPVDIVAHPVLVRLHVADAGLDGLVAVAVRLQAGDGEVDPPAVQLRLDPLHPRLPLAPARSESPHRRRRVFDGMELVEDEGRPRAGEDLFADVPDPCRPVGQHDQLFGLEQALPQPEPLEAPRELRRPAGAAFRPRAVDADADRPAAPVLPRLPGLRVPAFGRAGTMAFASRVFAAPSSCLPGTPSTSPAVIGTPVPSIPTRTRFAGGLRSPASARSNSSISWPILAPQRWSVDFGTRTPARFPSLRLASA